MSFRFKKAASVVVGTFNIYIVQPNWLAQVGILSEAAAYEMQADLDRPGFRFRVKETPHVWHVRPDRITLETESIDVDCGTPVASVIQALQWTPLLGIGTNLEYEAGVEELSRLKYKCQDVRVPEGYTLAQSTWHVAFKKGKQIFNFQVAHQPAGNDPAKTALSINVHTSVDRELKQVEANEIGQDACRKFLEHCREAVALMRTELGVEIES